jgi:hypothetical protein
VQDREPYAPDGTWIHIEEGRAPYIPTHGVNAEAYFPDVLRLPRGGVELGWKTGNEGTTTARSLRSHIPRRTNRVPWLWRAL